MSHNRCRHFSIVFALYRHFCRVFYQIFSLFLFSAGETTYFASSFAMELQGVCIIGNQTNENSSQAYIFSPEKLRVFSIRCTRRIGVGTWINARLGKPHNDVFDVLEYSVTNEPANSPKFLQVRDYLLIETNICFKWSRPCGKSELVASVELGEVLIDRPSFVNDNKVYMTRAVFNFDCARPPYGHFKSRGLLEEVSRAVEIEAMKVLKSRKKQQCRDVSTDIPREAEDAIIRAICIDVYPSGSEFIAECYCIQRRNMYKFRTKTLW